MMMADAPLSLAEVANAHELTYKTLSTLRK